MGAFSKNLSALWRWERGRQGTGYDKLLLAYSKTLKFDLYLLRFPENCEVPEHTDPVKPGFEHHRLNIDLVKPPFGGHTIVDGPVYRGKRWVLFRPDLDKHRMTAPLLGNMYMLSFGWLTVTRSS